MNTYNLRTADQGRLRITLDRFFGELLALHLGFEPETPEGYMAVYVWLQRELQSYPTGSAYEARQRLHARVLQTIIDPQLQHCLESWLDELAPDNLPPPRSFRALDGTSFMAAGRA
ncbi:hypothetical protein LRF89_12045 [Halorhodospira sp. 9621]|uniref:hypothetical protein n=1 Tax=Halorhodospira TaxID=85108 RepID=UPI001EE93465|nr:MULTISPECIES: hypothetical protein [Halorhodospira]MCG5529209.1 hypothetical protein [Halorhodospira halophila]MCG5534166.1 hypothetical protein [Halorhodospira sp. 9621]MCG5543100.1 hypothetical protein [Halorhodospira sp. 9628]